MDNRVTIRIEDSDKVKIEQRIKQEYPKIKNVSELVRAALNKYLEEPSQDKKEFETGVAA